MKYLPLPCFDVVSGALNFDTPDCRVTGSCDLYTTKAAGTDKKLYKNINQSLETQHAALLKFGESLSSPHRDSVAASLNLSRASPFGNLSEVSSRRTYAYLIATLNASHPDYDFSHVLRPADFKREKVLRRVMTNMDSTLSSIRPNSNFLGVAVPRNSPGAASSYSSSAGAAPRWGPQMWAMIDEEMTLKDCTVFSYQPRDDPFDEEEGAIWALHYFFFNKTRKRVCYLYVRGAPVMSHSHSPRLRPRAGSTDISMKRGLSSSDKGATKRARYWLGDRMAARITNGDDDMEDDDGLVWNRESNGDVDYDDDDDDEEFLYLDDAEDEESRSDTPRCVGEDVADRMDTAV